MRDRLIDALIQGDRLAWGVVAAVWLVGTLAVLLHRPGGTERRAAAWTWLLFTIATGASLVGIPLSAAIAVPRLRWAVVDTPELVNPSGESWRRLLGPAVVVPGPQPDVGVPTIDAEGRWVLFGMLSGTPVEGLPPAAPAPLQPGRPRLCKAEGDACRPWPVAWPDPDRPTLLGELVWAGAEGGPQAAPVASALAFDTETSLYLRRIERIEPPSGAPPGAPLLEVSGRFSGDAPREDVAMLLAVRRVSAGRLRAMRVIAMRATTGGFLFRLQRQEASLVAGRAAFTWVVRPLLVLTSLSLPLGVLALLLAPLLGKRRGRTRREASAWIAPYLEAAAVVAASVAIAAPAVVALANLWGSR